MLQVHEDKETGNQTPEATRNQGIRKNAPEAHHSHEVLGSQTSSPQKRKRPPRTSSLLPPRQFNPSYHTSSLEAINQAHSVERAGDPHRNDPISPGHYPPVDSAPHIDVPLPETGLPLFSGTALEAIETSANLNTITQNEWCQRDQVRKQDSFAPLPPLEPLPLLHVNDSFQESISSTIKSESVASSYEEAKMPSNGSQSRGHARSRSSKGSGDVDKNKSAKPPSQKAMLSRALQKANTAVQLDNAQNLEGARQAYSEACNLLQQVLQRTTTEEDKRKLEAIRQTYASRIDELDQMGPWPEEPSKALPARPESEEYNIAIPQPSALDVVDSASHSKEANWDSAQRYGRDSRDSRDKRLSTSRSPGGWDRHYGQQEPRQEQGHIKSSFSTSSTKLRGSGGQEHRPSDVPAPLSSHHQSPPRSNPDHSKFKSRPSDRPGGRHLRDSSQHSWLDGIGDSGGSTNSSLHSRTSSLGYRRKHFRGASGNTEAEFDTALDAAIEAAYDDGYEPAGADEFGHRDSNDQVVAKVLRKVELAREKVRQSERETWGLANGPDGQQSNFGSAQAGPGLSAGPAIGFYDENSSDEEERMLEEMARDYNIDDFTLRPQKTLAEPGPRQEPKHDSTEGSSQGQTLPTTSFSNSGLTEKSSLTNLNKNLGPAVPPPQHSLPELPLNRSVSPLQTVRNRRLSGQNPKQLKIETSKLGKPHSKQQSQDMDRDSEPIEIGNAEIVALQPPVLEASRSDIYGVPSPIGTKSVHDNDDYGSGRLMSPSVDNLRHNFSSTSLRSLKSRNMSLSNIEDASDMSPGTPSSNQFGSLRTPAMPTLPTPLGSEFRETMDGSAAGMYLFDNNLQLPSSPLSPADETSDAPVPLEPCPTDFMLRPFWLMRCLFQTIVHSRGGYLSTKLFVPRDVWRVKGVKLKNVDDKIANCDLLTAALLKLAQVDTCDADAVLEEMQSLEGILEQVQSTLSRKLGNEVGVQGSGALFKEASGTDGDGQSGMPRSTSVSAKSSFSWRRLRSKNSAMGLNSRGGGSETPKDNALLPSLPMTGQPTSRPAKRDLSLAQFVGPNASYMSSLARLFDAAQVIDQIARQVDDPGLRHADKTQVGLELCTRHAAEFFGFYICRFALADLGVLLEKFLKRGSEWVLA